MASIVNILGKNNNPKLSQELKILKTYLFQNNIVLNEKDLELHLLSNPDYPSIKAITDALDYFNIENLAANVPKEALFSLPKSFLSLISRSGQPIICLATLFENKVLVNDGKISNKISQEHFKEIWTGTIVAVEPNKGQISKQKPKYYPALIAATFLVACIFFLDGISQLFSIISLAGLFLGYQIFKEKLGEYSPTVTKFCCLVNKTGGCKTVISSAKGAILGISLSEGVIGFFAAQLLINITLGYNSFFFF